MCVCVVCNWKLQFHGTNKGIQLQIAQLIHLISCVRLKEFDCIAMHRIERRRKLESWKGDSNVDETFSQHGTTVAQSDAVHETIQVQTVSSTMHIYFERDNILALLSFFFFSSFMAFVVAILLKWQLTCAYSIWLLTGLTFTVQMFNVNQDRFFWPAVPFSGYSLCRIGMCVCFIKSECTTAFLCVCVFVWYCRI